MSEPAPRAGEASLRRELGVLLASLVVVNATIGTGIFKKPAQTARLVGSLPVSLAVWIAGGVIALCGALSFAELSASMPRTGGLYEYLRRAWGPRPAFLFGWARLALLIPSATGSFARLGSEALTSLFGLAPDARRETAVSLVILGACAAANAAGVRTSASAQGAVTALKYLGVVALAVAGLVVTPSALPALHGAAPEFATEPTARGIFTALVGVMWAYDGWSDLSSLSGEARDPERTLPRALVAGTLSVCAVYLAANLGYARVLGLDGLRASTTGVDMAASRLASATLGDVGMRALSALVFVSCVGACMSSLLTGPRVFVAMATDGVFAPWLGVVSPRSGVPVRAVLVSAALGCVYVSARSFEQLTDAFVVGLFPFYALSVAAVIKLRRTEPTMERPFRVPGYPWVPAVFLAGAAAVMVGALADADRNGLLALVVLAAGFPVQRWMRTRAEERAL